MVSCESCGNELDSWWEHCPSCGTPVASGAGPPPAPARRRRSRLLVTAVAVVGVLAVTAAAMAGVAVFGGSDDSTTGPSAKTGSGVGEEVGTQPPSTGPAGGEAEFAATFEQVRTGVARVRASTCEGTGAGSGFLVAEDRVATAAHVVAGAVTVSVETDAGTQVATVESIDAGRDLALLRLPAPGPGHVFDLADDDPGPGTAVAVLGHPLDGDLSISRGTVSGLHREITTDVGTFSGMMQTDAALNPGDSGGPVILADGRVVGVASATAPDHPGLGFAVEASRATPWFAHPSTDGPTATPVCETPLGPDHTTEIAPPGSSDWAAEVALTFTRYFGGINTGDYGLAWAQLSPDLGTALGLDEFAAATRSSYDFDIVVHEASYEAGRAEVWLGFTSIQDPSLGPTPGEACTFWSLDYVLLEQADGSFLIDEAQGHGDTDGHVPCT